MYKCMLVACVLQPILRHFSLNPILHQLRGIISRIVFRGQPPSLKKVPRVFAALDIFIHQATPTIVFGVLTVAIALVMFGIAGPPVAFNVNNMLRPFRTVALGIAGIGFGFEASAYLLHATRGPI